MPPLPTTANECGSKLSAARPSRNQNHHHKGHRDHRERPCVHFFSVYSVPSVADVFWNIVTHNAEASRPQR